MLELQSQPIPEGSQPLYGDEICKTVLSRRFGYSKDLGWGLKPKSRKSFASASSSSYNHQAYMAEVSQLKDNLEKANHVIEEQRLREEEWNRLVTNLDRQIVELDRQMEETVWIMEENYAWQMEEMRKMIENMSRTHSGPWTLGVHTFQHLICLILHMWYSNCTFMSFVCFAFFIWRSWLLDISKIGVGFYLFTFTLM